MKSQARLLSFVSDLLEILLVLCLLWKKPDIGLWHQRMKFEPSSSVLAAPEQNQGLRVKEQSHILEKVIPWTCSAANHHPACDLALFSHVRSWNASCLEAFHQPCNKNVSQWQKSQQDDTVDAKSSQLVPGSSGIKSPWFCATMQNTFQTPDIMWKHCHFH